jgi:SNF2 family DNA or RNA helicase
VYKGVEPLNIEHKKSIVYLKYFDDEDLPQWVTNDMPNTDPFFIINNINREKFRNEVYPLVKSGKYTINADTLSMIKGYETNNNKEFTHPQLWPDGIVLKEHQLKAVSIMLARNKYGFFLGTGTGKTLIAITFILNKKPDKVLIITPKKVIGQYRDECLKYLPSYKVTESINEFFTCNKCILVINYEQLSNILKANISNVNLLVLDESHYAKSYSSLANKNLRKLGVNIPNIYLFTGTPQDHSRHEIFPQLAILDERYMPVKTKFNHRYFYLNDYYLPDREKKWLSDELTDMIDSITWGKKSEDVIELTEEVNNIIKAEHPMYYYDDLIKDRIVKIQDHNIVADNKASLRIKLRELSNGHVIDGTDTLRVSNPKIDKLLELLRDKVPRGIVYFEFTADIPYIVDTIAYLGKSLVLVNGKTKNSDELIKKFKNNEVEYLVIQNRSGNAGLDLSHVNNVIFYSMPESYIVYHQCKARIRRIGQTEPCNYYHIISKGSIEEQIFKSLKNKKSFSNKVFNIYK